MSKRAIRKSRHRAGNQNLSFKDKVKLGMELKKMINAAKEMAEQKPEHVHDEHCKH